MAISTAAAILGSAALGAGGSAFAASQANNAAQKSADAITAANQQSTQLQRDMFDQITKQQQPYVNQGYAASGALGDRLGLNGSTSPDRAGYLAANPDVVNEFQRLSGTPEGRAYLQSQGVQSAEDFAGLHYSTFGQQEGRTMGTVQNLTADQQVAQQMGARPTMDTFSSFTAPNVPTLNPDDYRASDYYKYMVDETGRNTNSQFAARGMLQSGAAAKEMASRLNALASQDYQQWTQNELGKYDRTYTGALDSYKSTQNAAAQNNALKNSIYDTDYNRLLGQANTNTSNLINLMNTGQNAAANVGNAGQSMANNVGNLNSSSANALANSYGQQAANNNAALGNALGTAANGLYQLSGGYGSTVTPYGAPTQAYSPVTAGRTAASAPGLIYRPTVNF